SQKTRSAAAQDPAARARAGDRRADLAIGGVERGRPAGRRVDFRHDPGLSLDLALRGHHAEALSAARRSAATNPAGTTPAPEEPRRARIAGLFCSQGSSLKLEPMEQDMAASFRDAGTSAPGRN